MPTSSLWCQQRSHFSAVVAFTTNFNDASSVSTASLVASANGNTLEPEDNEHLIVGHILFGKNRNHISAKSPEQFLKTPNSHKDEFCVYYLSEKTLKLDALNRINLALIPLESKVIVCGAEIF